MTTPWGDLAWLRTVAEGLSDAVKARIATENRVKRGGLDKAPAYIDGELVADRMVREARELEEHYRGMLRGLYETQVPRHVRDWAEHTPGIGSGDLFPHLIGLLGHPRIAVPYRWEGKELVPAGEPYERSLRQLWQYAGCGDPDEPKWIWQRAKDRGGEITREDKLRAGKRTVIRPRLFTFSSYLVRQHTRSEAVASSHYYKVFVEAKLAAQGRVHSRPCRNRKVPPMRSNGCGTSANPEWGEIGSPWRPGHIDMHAHRIVHKEFLRDLWVISG